MIAVARLYGGPFDQHFRNLIFGFQKELRLDTPGPRTGAPLVTIYKCTGVSRRPEYYVYEYVGWE